MILPAGRFNHLIVEMANCGADEVFRDGDRAPRASIVVFEKSSDWQCSVQASRCDTRYTGSLGPRELQLVRTYR